MTRKIEFDDDGNIINQAANSDSGANKSVLSPRPEQQRTRRVLAPNAQQGGNPDDRPTARVKDAPKTRILRPESSSEEEVKNEAVDFVTGWLVITDGPGRGNSHQIGFGVNNIGRDRGQNVSLDYGDDAISREAHAYIAYDDEQQCFYINHGGKSNIVRLNSMPLLNMSELNHGDEIRIGKTKLRFIGLCGPDFNWGTH